MNEMNRKPRKTARLNAQVRSEIDALLSFVDAHLRSPHGGVQEGLPASMPRRQNPQMHLFEVMIAAFDATHDPVFQNRAGDFFAADFGVLGKVSVGFA